MNWSQYYFEFCSGIISSFGYLLLFPIKIVFTIVGIPTIKFLVAVLQATICWTLIFYQGLSLAWHYFKIVYPTLDYWIIEPTLDRVFTVLEAYIEGFIQLFLREPYEFVFYKIIKPIHLSTEKYTKDRDIYIEICVEESKKMLKIVKLILWELYTLGFIPLVVGYKCFLSMLREITLLIASLFAPSMEIATQLFTPDNITFTWYYRFRYMFRAFKSIFSKSSVVLFYVSEHLPPLPGVENNELTVYRVSLIPWAIVACLMYIPIETWFTEFMNRGGIHEDTWEFVEILEPQGLRMLIDTPGTLFSNWEHVEGLVFEDLEFFEIDKVEFKYITMVNYETDFVYNLWHYSTTNTEETFSIMEAIFLEIAWWVSW